MQRHQRLNAVIDLVARSGAISVEGITSEFGVSAATARRDLDDLAEQQLLSRTRGGAVAHSLSYELPLRYKPAQRSSATTRIASAAAAVVQPGDVVGMNGGTTTTAVARALCARDAPAAPRERFTVVTNALNIAAELTIWPQVKIVVPGGRARPRSYELVGPFARRTIESLTIDVMFLGVNALSAEGGAYADHEDEAQVAASMVERAARVVVVAESGKIGARAFCRICGVRQVDLLISDSRLSAERRARFEAAGVEVRGV